MIGSRRVGQPFEPASGRGFPVRGRRVNAERRNRSSLHNPPRRALCGELCCVGAGGYAIRLAVEVGVGLTGALRTLDVARNLPDT